MRIKRIFIYSSLRTCVTKHHVTSGKYFFSIVYKQWSLENAFEKKEKENIKRSIARVDSISTIFSSSQLLIIDL